MSNSTVRISTSKFIDFIDELELINDGMDFLLEYLNTSVECCAKHHVGTEVFSVILYRHLAKVTEEMNFCLKNYVVSDDVEQEPVQQSDSKILKVKDLRRKFKSEETLKS